MTDDDFKWQLDIARLTAERDGWETAYRSALEACGNFISERNKLREALHFYASEWLRRVHNAAPEEPTDALWDDKGERARAALKETTP